MYIYDFEITSSIVDDRNSSKVEMGAIRNRQRNEI